MTEKDHSHKAIIFILLLLLGGIWIGIIMLTDYFGITLADKTNDDNLNITGYCLAFLSLLLALRLVHIIYIKRKEGDWTKSGKARWRYCVYGAILLALIGIPIEHIKIPLTLKMVLGIIIGLVIALFLHGIYRKKYIP